MSQESLNISAIEIEGAAIGEDVAKWITKALQSGKAKFHRNLVEFAGTDKAGKSTQLLETFVELLHQNVPCILVRGSGTLAGTIELLDALDNDPRLAAFRENPSFIRSRANIAEARDLFLTYLQQRQGDPQGSIIRCQSGLLNIINREVESNPDALILADRGGVHAALGGREMAGNITMFNTISSFMPEVPIGNIVYMHVPQDELIRRNSSCTSGSSMRDVLLRAACINQVCSILAKGQNEVDNHPKITLVSGIGPIEASHWDVMEGLYTMRNISKAPWDLPSFKKDLRKN